MEHDSECRCDECLCLMLEDESPDDEVERLFERLDAFN